MADIQLMRCTKRSLNLTPAACGRLYKSTLTSAPQPWEGRFPCLGCSMGAKNAGHGASAAIEAATELKRLCVRCNTPAERQIHGRFCVSCYNRDREAKIGKNAKGGRPMLADMLHQPRIVAIAGGKKVGLGGPVVSPLEAMLVVARDAPNGAVFGLLPALSWGRGQRELGL